MKYGTGLVVKGLLSNTHFIKTDTMNVIFYLWAQMKFWSLLYIFNPICIKFSARYVHKTKLFRNLDLDKNLRTRTHVALGSVN